MSDWTIFKYRIPRTAASPQGDEMRLPRGFTILSVGHQIVQGVPELFLWAKIDRTVETHDPVHVWVVGTGHKIPDECHEHSVFLDRVSIPSVGLELHVFVSKVS